MKLGTIMLGGRKLGGEGGGSPLSDLELLR